MKIGGKATVGSLRFRSFDIIGFENFEYGARKCMQAFLSVQTLSVIHYWLKPAYRHRQPKSAAREETEICEAKNSPLPPTAFSFVTCAGSTKHGQSRWFG